MCVCEKVCEREREAEGSFGGRQRDDGEMVVEGINKEENRQAHRASRKRPGKKNT